MVFEKIWLGLTVVLTLVGVLNLFWQINSIVFLLVGGGVLFLSEGRYCILRIRKGVFQRPRLNTLRVLVLITLTCYLLASMTSPTNYDSGLYHFMAIRWLNESSLIPGLGHVESRLAFNSSWFNFVSFLNANPIFGNGHALSGLFILTLATVQIFKTKLQYKSDGKVFLLFVLVGVSASISQLSSPTPDIPISILKAVILILLMEFLVTNNNQEEALVKLITVIILSVAAVTIKLSVSGFALGTFLVAFYSLIRLQFKTRRVVIVLTAIVCIVMLAHFIRGYLLSGAPLFPSTIGGLWSLPWAMTETRVYEELRTVTCWARSPGPDCLKALGNFNWVSSWWFNLPLAFKVSLAAALASIVAFVYQHLLNKGPRSGSRWYLVPCMAPLVLDLLIWFFTAPDPRFLGATNWLIIGIFAGFVYRNIKIKYSSLNPNYNLLLYLSKARYPFYGKHVLCITLLSATFFNAPLDLVRVSRILESGFLDIPKANTSFKITKSGLILNVPNEGNGHLSEFQCWNSALPCTGYFNDDLALVENENGYPRKYFINLSTP